MLREIRHEYGFYEWFEEEFPCFTSDEGQKVLAQRADEIMKVINDYFPPWYMRQSTNAQYMENDIKNARAAYAKGDLKELGQALQSFKTACKWV